MSNARLGGPIATIVIGLVLALAVHKHVSGLDLSMIGWIIAGAGVLWLLLEVLVHRPRQAVTRETTNIQNGVDGRYVDRQVSHDNF